MCTKIQEMFHLKHKIEHGYTYTEIHNINEVILLNTLHSVLEFNQLQYHSPGRFL